MGLLCVLCLVFAFSGVARGAEELKYFIAFKGANQRGFWEETIAAFEKANPDIKVDASFIEEEAYKVQLPGWLTTEAPDLIRWHAGERMAYYAARGLLEDISDLWTENNWDASFSPSLKDVSSHDGKQFAMPNDFFSWGFYYRKDLFGKAGIAGEPKTWPEFLDACAKLKAAGVMPVAVGGRDSWTLAAWFDYINFRLNGFEFHMQLMRGEIPYTDDRVKAVYAEWRKLLDAGYFIDNPLSYTLDSVQPLINQGQAGMMIMGTFITGGIPAEILEKLGYFQFPVINPELPIAEDGSVDCMNIPSRAKNKAAARRFLTFVSQPEVLGRLAAVFGSIPANSSSPAPTDPIAKRGMEIIASAVGGVGQFYDRDMTKEMADEGMKGMQRFMSSPDAIDDILKGLERTRRRIYKVK